jgi:hypothetical protein
MGLSRRAYASLRGVHESAVRKATATGRITTEADGTITLVAGSLLRADQQADGTIDAAKADSMWDASTDLLPRRIFSSWVQKQLPASYWEWCRKSNSGFAKPPLDWTCRVGLHWHG